MVRFFFVVLFTFFLHSCASDDDGTPTGDSPIQTEDSQLLKVNNGQIINDDSEPILLQGICFNNWHWIESPLPPDDHHAEIDYQRVAEMGMNTVRFNLNYWVFEDDNNPYTYKQTAWDWIDNNIAWAKKNNIFLILNMHTPQGGYQSQGTGDALWEDAENQNRLLALWKAIAERYQDEAQIAGYGIVNEPVPSQNIGQWTSLAQRLINEIRTVDDHLIFVEQAIYVKNATEPDPNLNFPKVSGENIVYEFHSYEPFLYTHQNQDFANLNDGGSYPDETIAEMSDAQWYTGIFNNPALTTSAGWSYFEGERYLVNDPKIKIAQPIALVAGLNNGRAYFDDVTVKEYNSENTFIRNVFENDFENLDGWEFWSRNGSGESGVLGGAGTNGDTAAFIEGVTDEGNLGNRLRRFAPVQGNSYQISGYIRGENFPANALAQYRIDFYSGENEVMMRNKAYLEANLNQFVQWAKTNGAVLYLGEFGAGTPCFKEEKGGIRFVEDMVSLLKAQNIHFTYFDYHSDSFGIYSGFGALPNAVNANQNLIDFFTSTLN